MRKLCAILIIIILINQASAVQIEGYVTDPTGLLGSEERAQLESLLASIQQSGKAEYAIVIIDSLEGRDIEGYSYELAEGVLGDKEKNNGLLLLIALQDRQYRFEVGRGLEADLPDITMFRIGREYIEPNFREGQYAKGILEASQMIDFLLVGGELPEEDDGSALGIFLMIFFIVLAIIIISIAARGTKPSKRKDDDYFTAAWLLSQMFKGGRGGSGGFGGGSFGGGSFGGGSFGGGGSSGRW